MYAILNKRYNLRHIATIEIVEEPVIVTDPRNAQPARWYAFRIHLANGHVEQQLFEDEADRNAKWEELTNAMEEAGF